MKGFAYIDIDRNLHYRQYSFIEKEDPGFFSRNAHFIDIVWKFDTKDSVSMKQMLLSWANKELKVQVVKDFCKAINFDIDDFQRTNFQVKSGSDNFFKPSF